MRARAGLLAALASAALVGCGHTEVHHVSFQGEGGPRPAESTDLYLDSVPTRPFTAVGLVQAIGYGDDAREATVLAALRAAGRQRGCEALARVRYSQGAAAGHAIGVCVVWSVAP